MKLIVSSAQNKWHNHSISLVVAVYFDQIIAKQNMEVVSTEQDHQGLSDNLQKHSSLPSTDDIIQLPLNKTVTLKHDNETYILQTLL